MSKQELGEVVVIDDDESVLESMEIYLEMKGCTVRKSNDADGCLALFQAQPPDVAIIDIGLKDPTKDGIWLLKRLRAEYPDIPVIVLSGYSELEVGVRSMRLGAFDFLEKPAMPQYMFEVVKRSIEVGRVQQANRRLSAAMRTEPVEMVGSTAAVRKMRDLLEQQADKNCRVLLRGDIGSGKALAARFLHDRSPRRLKPFLVANCRLDDPDAVRELLFGSAGGVEKLPGSGESVAYDYRPGLLEQADGGSLYLDEVSDLPLEIQQELVVALVRGRFQRVGGGEAVGIDCRVFSGTTKDPQLLIDEGAFHKDLFDRLNVVSIDIPPLDARRDDIPELCHHFTTLLHQKSNLPKREFSRDALETLTSMHWPGNVKQLRNVVEKLLLNGLNDDVPVTAGEINLSDEGSIADAGTAMSEQYWKLSLREARNEFERQYLIGQINRCSGNISTAAKLVGMERSALHRKLKGLNVSTKAKSGFRIATARIGKS